jgi:hypothetical protein
MSDPITPLTPAQEAAKKESAAHENYVERLLVESDVALNVIAGGHPDETISSRASRGAVAGNPVGKALSDVLNVFQHDHGADAQAGDLERAETVTVLETGNGVLPTS